MKLFLIFIGAGLLVFMGVQIYSSLVYQGKLAGEFSDLEKKLEKAQADQEILNADVEYYAQPENLEKELRSRFHYRGEGEKMLIIVPHDTSSTTSTQE